MQLIKDFEATMIQVWAFLKKLPKQLKIYIKTTMQIKEFENLPKDKETKMIKLVKRDVRTRWLCVETAVDGAFKEYSHLSHVLREPQHDPKSGNTKGLLKKMDKIKFLLTVA